MILTILTTVSIRLALDMLDVLIHESSFHNTFWLTPNHTLPIPPLRARMIQRSIKASQTLFNALLEAPSSSLHLLSLPSWSNWFYSTLLAIRIVIFQRTGSTGSSCVHNTPHAIDDVIPTEFGESATAAVCNMTTSFSQASLRDKPVTAEEAWLVDMFEAFLHKLNGAIPLIFEEDTPGSPKAFLRQVAILQRGFLSGLKKVTEQARENNQMSANGGVNDGAKQRHTTVQNMRHEEIMATPHFTEDLSYLGLNFSQWPPSGEQIGSGQGLDNSSSTNYGDLPDPMDDFIWNMVIDEGNNMFAW